MFESPPVDLDMLRRLDATQVDHTNQGDSFLRVRSDVNAIANAAADEIETLREIVRTVSSVLGDPLHFSDERLGRAVQRAFDSGRNDQEESTC